MSESRNDMSTRDVFEAAVHWFTRSRVWTEKGLPVADAQEMAAFEAWLAADSRHVDAFEKVKRAFGDVTWAVEDRGVYDEPWILRPRTWAWGAAAAVLAACALFVGYHHVGPKVMVASTDFGETRALKMPDGTEVTLAAHSHLGVHYTHGLRQVTLTSGEAYFNVVHDRTRPFSVAVGPYEVRDIGTQFNIDKRETSIEIAVLSGEVALGKPGQSSANDIHLKAGQLLRVSLGGGHAQDAGGPAKTLAPAARVNRPDALVVSEVTPLSAAATRAAWREGRLAYDDAPLEDIVFDINRYYRPGVSLADAQLGKRRLTTVFAPKDINRFIDTLPLAVGAEVERAPDGHVILMARKAAAAP